MASIVQVATAEQSSVGNLSATFTDPVTAGNAIYCVGSCIVGYGIGENFTFSDAQGDIFTVIDTQTNLNLTPLSNSIAFNVAGGPTTVDMTLSYLGPSDNFVTNMIVMEVSGIGALDPGDPPAHPAHDVGYNSWAAPGSPTSLAPIRTVLANSFIIAAVQSVGVNSANTYTAGAGYTKNAQVDTLWNGSTTGYSCLGVESGAVVTAGDYTPTIIGTQQPQYPIGFSGPNLVVAFATVEPPPPPPSPTAVRCVDVELSGTMNTLELTRDLDADWKSDSTFIITQDEPLPFTLRGIVLRLTYEPD